MVIIINRANLAFFSTHLSVVYVRSVIPIWQICSSNLLVYSNSQVDECRTDSNSIGRPKRLQLIKSAQDD